MANKVVNILQNFALFHQYHHANQPLRIQTLCYWKLHSFTSFSSTLMVTWKKIGNCQISHENIEKSILEKKENHHDIKNIEKKSSKDNLTLYYPLPKTFKQCKLFFQVAFRMKIMKIIAANMSFTFFAIVICFGVLSLSSFRVHLIGT